MSRNFRISIMVTKLNQTFEQNLSRYTGPGMNEVVCDTGGKVGGVVKDKVELTWNQHMMGKHIVDEHQMEFDSNTT